MMCLLGLSLSVGNLVGNPILNFALLGGAEIIARLGFMTFMRIFPSRRKILTVVSFFALGITCISIGL